MAVEVKDLLAGVQVADSAGNPTAELVEIIQRIVDALRDHEQRLTDIDGGSP